MPLKYSSISLYCPLNEGTKRCRGGGDLITLLTPVATKNVDYPRRSWYFSATELLTIAGVEGGGGVSL
jgi:hypothetical protein